MTFNNDAIQIMYLGIAQTVGPKTTDLVQNVFAVKKVLDSLDCKRVASSSIEKLKKEIEASVNDYCSSDEVEVANQRLVMSGVLDLAKEELQSLTKLLEKDEKDTDGTGNTCCKHGDGHTCSGECHCHNKGDKQVEDTENEGDAENEDVRAAKILDKSADALSSIIDGLLGMVDTIKTRPEDVPNAFAGKVNEALNSAKELKRGISEEIKRRVAEKEAADGLEDDEAAGHSIYFGDNGVEIDLHKKAADARKKYASNNGLCHQWRLRKDLFQWFYNGTTFDNSTSFQGIADVLGIHIVVNCTGVQEINGKGKEFILMEVAMPDNGVKFIAKDVIDMQKIAQSYAQYYLNEMMQNIVDYNGALGFEVEYRRMKAVLSGDTSFKPEKTLAGKELEKELKRKPWL